MDIHENLNFFGQLVACIYNLGLHSYEPERIFSPSDAADPTANDDDSLIFLSLEEPLKKHIAQKRKTPLFIDHQLGLIWIVAFEYEVENLRGIHVLGPAYSGKNSYQFIKKELDRHDLSVTIRSRVFRLFEQIPVIPVNQLFQYAVMLHYCVTGERITTSDLTYAKTSEKDRPADPGLAAKDHRGVWIAEQQLLQMLREGNPDYLNALARSNNLSDGPRFDIGDSLRKAKSTSIVLLTLCSRAAIEGGVNPSVAYTLNDSYMQMIEECETVTEISNTCAALLKDYVGRVRQSKEKKELSGQIRIICDYIAVHIREKLSIAELADQAGYTEYYFSHKFREETGVSVADYIRRKKIREAELLLAGTRMSIQEISDELSFGSRSYFSTSFQKETGLSPSEYRERHLKI